jgi:hypothetical protein
MKYEVLEYFEDLLDNRRKYFPGDAYPRRGLKPTAERLEELSNDRNRRGVPLIKEEQKEDNETQTEAES